MLKNFNTTTLGWKFNHVQTRAVIRKRSRYDFVISIIIAFLIIFIVSQILAFVDQKIRSPYLSALNPLQVNQSHAASQEAIKMIQSHREINILKGSAFTFTVGFKNNGSLNWHEKGEGKVELKLADQSKKSIARHVFWRDDVTPAWLKGDINKPGWIGYYKFALQAPEQAGIYTEKFVLVRNGWEQVSGSEFEITLNVWDTAADFPKQYAKKVKPEVKGQKKIIPQKTDNPNVGVDPISSDKKKKVQACLSLTTKKFIIASKKINGINTITQQEFDQCKKLRIDLSNNVVDPEDYGIIVDQPAAAKNSAQNSSNNDNVNVSIKTEEPILRIGLFHTKDPIIITANKNYELVDKNKNILEKLSANQKITITYDFEQSEYNYKIGSSKTQSNSYLRLEPVKNNTIFEVISYENRPKWNTSLNDNTFRGEMEVRYSPNTGRLWLINELPMETYLKGLAESSNVSPMEYQKALMTAARTYAMHHYNKGTKHANEYFTLDAKYDQVYKGYGTESRLPKVSEAVEQTRGHVVTYDGEIAITPYFSHSDGRTRDWSEVWGGDIPWCKSVEEPQDYDKDYLYGHGVGMSARGAIFLANDDLNYQEILKYYYTGVDIDKIYN